MAQVFISFIHEEEGYAEAVKTFLADLLGPNATPFLSSDKLQVFAGEKWLDRITEELRKAEVFLLMLSPTSVTRPWVNFEAGAAWTGGRVIIPICYRGLRRDGLPKPYSSLQAVDLNGYGEDEYLATSVAHHLKVERPLTHIEAILSGIGPAEYTAKCKRVDQIYTTLSDRIIDLDKQAEHLDVPKLPKD
jgi:hypothetical protein